MGGYNSIDDLGLHSIHKGAASYLALIPGGPSPAAICLQGGWLMGQIKDIHLVTNLLAGMRHCSICFGEILQRPSVVFDSAIEESWVDAIVQEVFPAFVGVEGSMQRILWMYLASAKLSCKEYSHLQRYFQDAICNWKDQDRLLLGRQLWYDYWGASTH
jgi:hypothetical protein